MVRRVIDLKKLMTGKRTRGRNFMLVGWMLESILFPGGPSMSGIYCQLIVCIQVVLICLRTEYIIS